MSFVMHFDTEFSFEKSVHVLQALCSQHRYCDFSVMDALNRSDWRFLSNFEMKYFSAHSWEYVRDTRQVLAYFSKNASIPLGIDTKEVALTKFLSCEMTNLSTNRRFRIRFGEESPDAALIFRMQRKIAKILGPFPGIDKLDFGFGPGANVGVSRLTSVRRKISSAPTVTTDASKYLDDIRGQAPHWESLHTPVLTDYARLTFVPKNAKTDRPIAVEPLLNSYLQKGFGDFIRRALLRHGCDLSSQKRNQDLALIGSETGYYATLDLASASDTISSEVVKDLLPYEWWYHLDSVRTPVVKLPDGRFLYQQKFSSMGNGFTFELESLIFYALCLCFTEASDCSVYGDDIIVPVSVASDVSAALAELGFTLNGEKSFCDGPFRESCGRDFFGGFDVRPCYVKGALSIKELFRLHNFFVRNCEEDKADILVKYIPKRFRLFGPDGFGDGHLVSTTAGDRKVKNGYGGYVFRTYTMKPHVRRDPLHGDYAALLYMYSKPRQFGGPRGLPFLSSNLCSDRPALDGLYQERGSTKYKLSRIYHLG